MPETKVIDGVELTLSEPDIIENMQWIGGDVYMAQLLAAWTVVDKKDIPLNPQILGKPGVGKTTLAYSAAQTLHRNVYIYQCTVDTRPEDLLISPVIAENNTIKYHASSLVTAMIKGGVCILDEANRMAEKSWASLAPLLDQRRYIESIIAGIKVQAHPNFRICVTMNDDTSTFEVPEYIHSRLQPQIFIEFPEQEEEFRILQFNLPFVKEDLILYTVEFLQRAHRAEKIYTVRDGINICRYYTKLKNAGVNPVNLLSSADLINDLKEITKSEPKTEPNTGSKADSKPVAVDISLFEHVLRQILGREAVEFLHQKGSKFDKKPHGFDPSTRRFGLLNDDDMPDEEDEEDFDHAFGEDGNNKGKGPHDLFHSDWDDLNEDDLSDDSTDDSSDLPHDKEFDDADEDREEDAENDEDFLHIIEKKSKPSRKLKLEPEDEEFFEDLDGLNDHRTKNQDDSNAKLQNPDDLIRDLLAKSKKKKTKDKDKNNK